MLMLQMILLNKLHWLLTKMWWKVKYQWVWIFHPHNSGLNALTQELSRWTHNTDQRKRILALQQMFSAPAGEKVAGVNSLTESYHKYKREYVKNLSFKPEEENLSKGSIQKEKNMPPSWAKFLKLTNFSCNDRERLKIKWTLSDRIDQTLPPLDG